MAYIVIDAGHGGKDSGAVGFGLYEKNVCMELAKRMNDHLGQYKKAVVSLTRWDDRFLELSDRAKFANARGADLFVSLHNNAAGSAAAQGFETFIHNNASDRTASYQNIIHNRVIKYLNKYNIHDRGKKRANFAVVRETKMPALLLENLFITNERENKLLRDPNFIDGLAQAIVEGIADALGLVKKDMTPKPMYSVTVDGKKIYDTAYESKILDAARDGITKGAKEIKLIRL
jgi:N-acetylmuramoyl-L-alanine amidase